MNRGCWLGDEPWQSGRGGGLYPFLCLTLATFAALRCTHRARGGRGFLCRMDHKVRKGQRLLELPIARNCSIAAASLRSMRSLR